jgi:hypothetical protein
MVQEFMSSVQNPAGLAGENNNPGAPNLPGNVLNRRGSDGDPLFPLKKVCFKEF